MQARESGLNVKIIDAVFLQERGAVAAVFVQLFEGKQDLQKRSPPLVERDRVAGVRGTEQLSVSLRLLASEEDLELMIAQLHSAITVPHVHDHLPPQHAIRVPVRMLRLRCPLRLPFPLASAKKHLTLLVPARLATTDFRLRASGHQTFVPVTILPSSTTRQSNFEDVLSVCQVVQPRLGWLRRV